MDPFWHLRRCFVKGAASRHISRARGSRCGPFIVAADVGEHED